MLHLNRENAIVSATQNGLSPHLLSMKNGCDSSVRVTLSQHLQHSWHRFLLPKLSSPNGMLNRYEPLFFNEKKKIYSTFSARRSANEKKKRVASKKGGRFDFLVSKWNSVDVNGCLFTSKIMHTLMSIDFPTIWPSSVVVDGTPRQTIWIPFLLDRLNDWAPVRFPIDLLQPKMTWNKRTSKKYGRLTVALHFGRGFEKT